MQDDEINYSRLTRAQLFSEASFILEDLRDSLDGYSLSALAQAYRAAAEMLAPLEMDFQETGASFSLMDLSSFRAKVSDRVKNNDLAASILDSMGKNYRVKGKEKLPYEAFFVALLEQTKSLFEKDFFRKEDRNILRGVLPSRVLNLPQTFLSYAMADKGLSFALFLYFLRRGGFLFVDWMWSSAIKDGRIIKKNLEDALTKSSQFLFLRTPQSELLVKSKQTIRQWCAWEIGNFYSKACGNKYLLSFYGDGKTRNDLLDTFLPMHSVLNGVII